MRCPYCAEDVKDDAVVCKHCHSELFVVKPLLGKINELTARLTSLEETGKHADADAPVPVRRAAAHHHERGLTIWGAVSFAYIAHVVLHFLITVQFDLRLIYFKVISLTIPFIAGAFCRQSERWMLSKALLIGFILAAATIASELAVIAAVDKVPFLPQSSAEWKEFAMHSASIAFGFLCGVIVRQMLTVIYMPSAKTNKSIDVIARFIVEQFGDGKNKFTLKGVRSIVNSVLGFVSACVSILAGLWEYLIK